MSIEIKPGRYFIAWWMIGNGSTHVSGVSSVKTPKLMTRPGEVVTWEDVLQRSERALDVIARHVAGDRTVARGVRLDFSDGETWTLGRDRRGRTTITRSRRDPARDLDVLFGRSR